MNRKATLPNRQDTNVRAAPHDLAASRPGGVLGDLGACAPCDCLKVGSIADCGLCPRGAPLRWTFRFPEISAVLAQASSFTVVPLPLITHELNHAAGCTWEGDSTQVDCDYVPDDFGFSLSIAGADAGANALILERLVGNNCPPVRVVYRNMLPWRCTCANLMLLSPDETADVNLNLLPCSVCLRPTSSCETTHWETTVPGIGGPWRTVSDAALHTGPLCPGVFNDAAMHAECIRWSERDPTSGLFLQMVVFNCYIGSGPFGGNPWPGPDGPFYFWPHPLGGSSAIIARFRTEIDGVRVAEYHWDKITGLAHWNDFVGLYPLLPGWPATITLTPLL